MEPDIVSLLDQLDAAERDAVALVTGLTEAQGTWRSDPGSWSVAECLDHLAVANRVYLDAMKEPARQALERNQLRRGPARPGLLGGWFARSLEPPPRRAFRTKAPKAIRPAASPRLGDAFASFQASQQRVREFLTEYAGIDLASVTFPNPFLKGLRLSLATGLHVTAAHERRHLWQAWRVRERAVSVTPSA